MKYVGVVLILLFCSCHSNNFEAMKRDLNGYWEIEKVIDADGTEKSFSMSTTIDFIEVNKDKGVRKKVAPQLDGTFLTFAQTEEFDIIIENDRLLLNYKTPYDEWEEVVLTATPDQLITKNADSKKYYYKKFQPITISNE